MPQMPQENISSYVFPTTDLFTNQKLHPKGSVAKIVTNSSPMPFQTPFHPNQAGHVPSPTSLCENKKKVMGMYGM